MQEAGLAKSDLSLHKRSLLDELRSEQLERILTVLADRFSVQRGQIELLEFYEGTINTVYEISVKGARYGIKVRTNEEIFQYEKPIIKEVIVAALLGKRSTEQESLECISSVVGKVRGGPLERTEVTSRIEYYDWSRELVDVPFVVYDWASAHPLSTLQSKVHYERAGKLLRRLHQIRFPAFIRAFDTFEREQTSWQERFSLLLSSAIEQASFYLGGQVARTLAQITVPNSPEMNDGPCLVHNDFYGANILVASNSKVSVIDWDNAVVDCAHLDFVKMKYWTKKHQDLFCSDNELFRCFASAYGKRGEEIIASPVFRLYELLWLLRVYKFERLKEQKGLPLTSGFPPASAYLRLIERLLNA